MALKLWSQLANNELAAKWEVDNAVANNLMWYAPAPDVDPGNPPPIPGWENESRSDFRCLTKWEFERYIWTEGTSPVGIDEYMTKAEMIAYARVYVPPKVSNFNAMMLMSSCPGPTVTVDLSWTNPTNSNGPKTIQYRRASNLAWITIASGLTASATTFRHFGADEGFSVGYRIGIPVTGQVTEWVQGGTGTACPL